MLESLAALRAKAQSAPVTALEAQASGPADQGTPAQEAPAPEFPANDTPLQVPAAIERLRRSKDRPIPA